MRIFGQDRTRAAALSVSIEIDEADQAFEVEQKLKNKNLQPVRVTQWKILGQGQKLGITYTFRNIAEASRAYVVLSEFRPDETEEKGEDSVERNFQYLMT